jgi:hypothetical protein
MNVKFGDVFYSEYFKSKGVVVKYIDDKDWWFVIESQPSRILKAQADPIQLKWEEK